MGLNESGRLARIESKLENIHEDLKEGAKRFEKHEERLNECEREQARVKENLRWTQRIGAAVITFLSGVFHVTHSK